MSSRVAGSRVDEFRASVASSVQPGLVRDSGLDAYIVDGMAPELVVSPASEGELANVLADAHAFGLAAIAFGAGNHIALGNMPSAYDVAIATGELNRIVAHEPADLTVTVEPGVPLSHLKEVLAAHNQFLPLDPPCSDATIGGLIATAAQGPMRHAFGTVRDWLLGVRIVHADGSISKAGGRVVKNVTGYEMTKLYAGSLGTLGVISEATFKLVPSPSSARTIALTFDSPHAAATVALAAQDAGLALHAVELLSPPAAFAVLGEARWSLLMRLAGTQGAVERSMRELTAFAAGLRANAIEGDDEPWQRWNDVFAHAKLALRLSVQPSSVADAIEILDRRFAGAAATISATVSAGVVRANLRPSREHRAATLMQHSREVAARFDGHVIVDVAPVSYKHEHDVFGPLRPDFAIMARMKDEFDPRRVLSPGRFVGRL
jgi:glycolate oxidase FAD binding subunit